MKLSQKIEMTRLAAETAFLSCLSREMGARHIVRKLSEIPGVPAKVGQFLGMKFGVSAHAELRIPRAQVIDMISREQSELAKLISHIDEAVTVASLSQVHSVWLKDGRHLALKIQFPGIEEELEGQLQTVFDAFEKYGPRTIEGEDFKKFKDHFSRSLAAELDYSAEISAQKQFYDFFETDDEVLVSRVYPQWSSAHIIAQDFVSSDSLDRLKNVVSEEKRRIAEALVRMHLKCIFGGGPVHGDLHPGNWGYDLESKRVVLYDFGNVLRLTPEQSRALLNLIQLDAFASPMDYLFAYADLGFEAEKLSLIADRLPQLTQIVFEPFRCYGERSLDDWRMSERVTQLLGENKWLFRLAGPAWFMSLLKSCGGISYSIRQLDVHLNFSRLLSEIFEEFKPQGLFCSTVAHSCKLKISVKESGNEIVSLELPVSSAADLESLVPSYIREKIMAAGIELSRITARARESGYSPQELFDMKLHNKTYRVWLE